MWKTVYADRCKRIPDNIERTIPVISPETTPGSGTDFILFFTGKEPGVNSQAPVPYVPEAHTGVVFPGDRPCI